MSQQVKVVSSVVQPDRKLAVQSHPYDASADTRMVKNASLIEYCFDLDLFVTGAVGFGQWHPSSSKHGLARDDHVVLDLMCYIAYTLAHDNGCDSVCVTYELVYSDTPQKTPIAFKLRVTNTNLDAGTPMSALLDQLFELNKENEAKIAEQTAKGKNTKPTNSKYPYRQMVKSEYVALCARLTGRRYPSSDTAGDLVIEQHPLDPVRVFTLENACDTAERLEADPIFYRLSNYVSGSSSRVKFPDQGANVWSVSAMSMNPAVVVRSFFPHVAVPKTHVDVKQLAKVIQRRKPLRRELTGDDEQNTDMIRQREEDATREYERLIGLDVSHAGCNDLTHARDWYMGELAKRTAALGPDPTHGIALDDQTRAEKAAHGTWYLEWTKMRRAMQLEGLERWAQIFNPVGQVGDSVKAISTWFDEFIAKYGTVCMPRTRTTSNASHLAEMLAGMAIQLERTFAVNTAHTDILSAWLACMHVYSKKEFHAHTILVGEHSTGKSNVLKTVNKMCIPGTTKQPSCVTARAHMVNGNSQDLSIQIHEEILPSTIGVVPTGTNGGKQASSGTSDAEALLKQRLTTGKSEYSRLMKDEDGKWVADEGVSECNIVLLAATNIARLDIPDATSSRFNLVDFQAKERDGRSIADVNQALENKTASQLAVEEKFLLKQHRNQALIAMLFTLNFMGVLKLDTTAAQLVVVKTLQVGADHGMVHTSQPRHGARVTCHAEVLTLLSAIDKMCDSPNSPLKGRAWDITQLLEFETHMVATEECASAAFGFLENTFVDSTLQCLMKHLKTSVFEMPGDKEKRTRLEEANKKKAQLTTGAQSSSSSQVGSSSSSSARPITIPVNGRSANALRRSFAQPALVPFANSDEGEEKRGSGVITGYVAPGEVEKVGNTRIRSVPHIDISNNPALLTAGIPAPNQPEWIDAFANECHARMVSKPKKEDVRAAVVRLLAQTVQVEEPSKEDPLKMVMVKDPVLQLLQGKWIIAQRALDLHTDTIVKDCVLRVLNYPGNVKRDVLYGHTKDDLPYVFDMLTVNPPILSRLHPHMVIRNPKYHAPETDRLFAGSVDGVIPEKCVDLTDMGSDEPFHVVMEPLDKYASWKHVTDIGRVNDPRLKEMHPYAHAYYLSEIRSIHPRDAKALVPYPADIEKAGSKMKQDQLYLEKLKANPMAYALETRHTRCKKRKRDDTEEDDMGVESDEPDSRVLTEIQQDVDIDSDACMDTSSFSSWESVSLDRFPSSSSSR